MPAKAAPLKHCPRCFFSEDRIGTCGSFRLGCPPPAEVDPARSIRVECTACDKSLVVPITAVMKGRLSQLGRCTRDECQARIIFPESAQAKLDVPPPLSEAQVPVKRKAK